MERRVTIKDIAAKAGVSLRSVHCALNGKPGVSEDTRKRIIDIARECDYRPNILASSLKRKAITIGVALPGPTEENRFYFSQAWDGAREYVKSIGDYNIEVVEVPFSSEWHDHAAGLTDLLERHKVEGLLTVGSMDADGREALWQFFDRGIPVTLMGGDIPDSGRLCCVMPDYNVIGRVMAELLTRQVRGEGEVVLCAGDAVIPSHSEVVAGFEAYVRERGVGIPVRKIGVKGDGTFFNRLLAEFEKGNVAGCACVNARGSVRMGRALAQSGLAGRIPAVASDLFDENAQFLRDDVFTNIIHKNPYSQSYLAAKVLIEALLRDAKPASGVIHVGSEVIFQSSLPLASENRFSLEEVRRVGEVPGWV